MSDTKEPKHEESIVGIQLSELQYLPNHPFKVRDDTAMQETAQSIKEYGVLLPAIIRPKEDGRGYEIVSGIGENMTVSLQDCPKYPASSE